MKFHGCYVRVISLFSHDGTPVSQMIFTLPDSHILNLLHLASQTVGVVRFLDLELGLSDDRWLLYI